MAYPLFVNRVSEIVSKMGFVLALTNLVVSAITFLVNRLSDIKMRRAEFATIGMVLNAKWLFLVGVPPHPNT